MRNSNLFPVNAKGEVRLRSVVEFRQRVDTDAHSDFLARIVCRSVFDRRQYLVKLLSEEDRDYRGGSLLRAEAVVVRRRCHGYAEQVLIIVDRFDHRDKK